METEPPRKKLPRSSSVDSLTLVGAACYGFGGLVSLGMIGLVYVARDKKQHLKPLVCVKLKVLGEVRCIKGCVTLLDYFSTPTHIKIRRIF